MSLYEKLSSIPIFDTHMHASSISSVGFQDGGFVTDKVPGKGAGETTLITLLKAPYIIGLHFQTRAYCAPDSDNFLCEWNALLPCLEMERGTGLFMALDEALADLYGISLTRALDEGAETAKELSDMISERYRKDFFGWSAQTMRRAGIIKALKPIHASYLTAVAEGTALPDYAKERRMYVPILRTDDLTGMVVGGRLTFPALTGDIRSLAALEAEMDRLYECIRRTGSPCVKQATAYDRTLYFEYRTRAEADAAFTKALSGDPAAIKTVQDYIIERVLSRGMKYQIHTGMANLGNTSPLLLRDMIERHPEVDFVLLHGYPHISEALNMAFMYKNVYFDLSWLQLLSPELLRRTLREAIGFVPMNKLFLSTDATSPEEQYGAAMGLRRALAQVLEEKLEYDLWTEKTALMWAHALLHKNAESFYAP